MLRSAAFPRGVSKLHTDAAGPAPPPDAFGPFRVLHQIGAGALGPVYKTYQAELSRPVAVKMLPEPMTVWRTSALPMREER